MTKKVPGTFFAALLCLVVLAACSGATTDAPGGGTTDAQGERTAETTGDGSATTGSAVGGGGSATTKAPAGSELTVRLVVSDKASRRVLPSGQWTARLEKQPAGAATPPLGFRPAGDSGAIAGPVEAGIPYSLQIESKGFIPLTAVVTFREGVDNRLNVSLDRAPSSATRGDRAP